MWLTKYKIRFICINLIKETCLILSKVETKYAFKYIFISIRHFKNRCSERKYFIIPNNLNQVE